MDGTFSEQYDRLPPHSIDAERCVLASMMLDPDCVPMVRGLLVRDAFYQADHQLVFDVITDLHQRCGRKLDTMLVREELIQRCQLEEIGGTAHLAQMLNAVPSAAHVEHYARVVRDKYVWRLGIAASNEFLRAAYRPHKGDDAAAAAARETADAFAAAAASGYADDFRSIEAIVQDVYEAAERGDCRFITTGLSRIDQHAGGLPVGGFTQVGGRPGTGKSQTARQVAYNCAKAGIPAAIISVEETEHKIGANLLAAASGVKNSRIVFGRVSGANEWKQLAEGAGRLAGLPLYVSDKPVKLDEVVAAVAIAVTKYRCQVVVVDYLQLIDPESGENENREITLVSRALKAAFKRLNVAGLVAVQLNRGNEGAGGVGSVRLPALRDLRGSGSLEQDGDLIILLHREDVYHRGERDYTPTNQIEAVIAKNKNGQTGVIPLKFDGDTQTVSDWPEDDVFAPASMIDGGEAF